MSLPVLSNAMRVVKYGHPKSKRMQASLVTITLFDVPDVHLHRKCVAKFQAWERSVRTYEETTVTGIGGKRRPMVLPANRFKPTRIDSFNARKKRTPSGTQGTSWSLHAFGCAVDIWPNPYPAYVTNRAQKRGLTCGSSWSKKYYDPMHTEWRR